MNIFNNFYTEQKTQSNQGVNKNNVLNSIEKASKKTGVDFSYLVEQAAAESSMNPTAKAKTSSAEGLFQFLDSTWLNMVKNHGDKHGMGQYADMIQKTESGRYTVSNPALKQEILNARNNPEKASAMAAELAKSNEQYLKQHVPNVEIGKTELYLAHFMGANGAARFLNAMNSNPDANAAQTFKTEAKANKNVFFDKGTHKPRSLEQVYAFFDKKFDGDMNVAPDAVQEIKVAKMNAEPLKEAGFVMDDGTPLYLSSMPSVNANQSMGYTRKINAETLYFIQQLTSDMERVAFGDSVNTIKLNDFV